MKQSEKPDTKNYLIPVGDEVIKSRELGRTTSSMTRAQRVGFAALLKNAYPQLLANNDQTVFTISTKQLLGDMGIKHRNVFSILGSDKKRSEIIEHKKQAGDFSGKITINDIDPKERRLEDQLIELQHNSIQWRYKNRRGKTVVESHVMLPSFKMDESTVTYEFTSFVRNRILCDGNAYIGNMTIISSFKSTYAVALYELLLQKDRRDIKEQQFWVCDIDELKEYLGGDELKNKPMRKNNFKSTIVDKAVEEINDRSRFVLQVENIREGREVVAYQFIWTKKKQHSKSTDIDAEVVTIHEERPSGELMEFINHVRERYVKVLVFNEEGKEAEEFGVKNKRLLTKNDKTIRKDEALSTWRYIYENQSTTRFLVPGEGIGTRMPNLFDQLEQY